MNINPKKSWHVRSKKNLAKVRKDEAKAAEEEKEKQRKIDLAESEARSELLRSLAVKKFVTEECKGAEVEVKKLGHVNFFEDLEAGDKVARRNKEHEEEERKKQEKIEMDVGLLTFLGQGSSEFEGKKPWYLDKKPDPKDEVQLKSKLSLDPLRTMKHYLELTDKYEDIKKGKHFDPKSESKVHKSLKVKSKTTHKKTIQELREERIARERKERVKAEKLIRGDVNEKKEVVVTDLRKMSYNSRFNPELPRFK